MQVILRIVLLAIVIAAQNTSAGVCLDLFAPSSNPIRIDRGGFHFINELAKSSGLSLSRVEAVYKSTGAADLKQRELISDILEPIRLDGTMRWQTFAGALQKLTVIEHLNEPRTLRRFLQPGILFSEAVNERARFETMLRRSYGFLVEHQLLDARDVRDGLNPPTYRRMVRRFSISVIINSIALYSFGNAIDVPPLQILTLKTLPSKYHGAEEISRYFRKYAVLDMSLDKGRKALIAYVLVSFGIFVGSEIGTVVDFVRPFLVSNERLERVQAEKFSADRIRSVQFESWRSSFHDLEGRWPDPAIPSDRAEIETVQRQLASMTEQELRVNYLQQVE